MLSNTNLPDIKNLPAEIKKMNDVFSFDWNNYQSIAANKHKLAEVENFIMQTSSLLKNLNIQDCYAFGELCYKVGSFYNHVKGDPCSALRFLSLAEKYSDAKLKDWIDNHFAYSYQQLLAKAKKDKNQVQIETDASISFGFCYKVISKHPTENADKETIKVVGFAYCVAALIEYECDHLDIAETAYKFALDLYEKHNLIDDQYARAKNRYAQILAEENKHDAAAKAFSELELYWANREDSLYKAKYLISHARFLEENQEYDLVVYEKFKKAHEILVVTEGPNSPFTKDIAKKVSELEQKFVDQSCNKLLQDIVEQMAVLPFAARKLVIESLGTTLLQDIPMSGKTVQQHSNANEFLLSRMNHFLKAKSFNNNNERYVYQFAREATSAGIIPVYRDKKHGELYVGLICNSRNPEMYNHSAGYSEAPKPGWDGNLQSEKEKEIYFNRGKVIEVAREEMQKAIDAADGDWTKVEYDYQKFANAFASKNVPLPSNTDISSFHTAARECLEEMCLDINNYPDKKIFLVSSDNTVGVSQGDAPGQLSNRSHQYMVYLGEFDKPPAIKPNDDVVIADWVSVSEIERRDSTHYFANGKSLCPYMLRSLENGLKQVWGYLIEQSSTKKSRFIDKNIVHFSSLESIAAKLEDFCGDGDKNIKNFLNIITSDLPDQTRTGGMSHHILQYLLTVAHYLTHNNTSQMPREKFVKNLNALLAPMASILNVGQSNTIEKLAFEGNGARKMSL